MCRWNQNGSINDGKKSFHPASKFILQLENELILIFDRKQTQKIAHERHREENEVPLQKPAHIAHTREPVDRIDTPDKVRNLQKKGFWEDNTQN